MTDSYEVDGITITPQAGGYYELTHSSLTVPQRVRGKEKADTLAQEIAAAARNPEGTMEQQPPAETLQPITDVVPKSDFDQLKAMFEAQQAQIAELLARPAATVVTEGEAPAHDPLQIIPTAFTGQATAAQQAAAAAVGVKYVTIILEENSDIPPTGLFVGHNFRNYMIMPGEPVDVPDFILGVLDDAIMSSPITDQKTQKVLGYRSRMKYPYRRL